jgi:hypothetical protein
MMSNEQLNNALVLACEPEVARIMNRALGEGPPSLATCAALSQAISLKRIAYILERHYEEL